MSITDNEIFKDKILGNFLGVAIGDALGKPVEMKTREQIVDKYGLLKEYVDCSDHKYFKNDPKGMTTDDWQLTKAIARAMIDAGGIDMDRIAQEHIREFSASVTGWGGSTRESVARLSEGTHWAISGVSDKPNRGFGNGVCMKISPVGLYMGINCVKNYEQKHDYIDNIANIALMTHSTNIAVTSGVAHAFATFNCFMTSPTHASLEEFRSDFVNTIIRCAKACKKLAKEEGPYDIQERFEKLKEAHLWTNEQVIEEFGAGSCSVFDSLPFTYAFFLRSPSLFNDPKYSAYPFGEAPEHYYAPAKDIIYECVTSGGDTDTNASMLCGLLGTLNGWQVFPPHLVDGLANKEEVFNLANDFCVKFLGQGLSHRTFRGSAEPIRLLSESIGRMGHVTKVKSDLRTGTRDF